MIDKLRERLERISETVDSFTTLTTVVVGRVEGIMATLDAFHRYARAVSEWQRQWTAWAKRIDERLAYLETPPERRPN